MTVRPAYVYPILLTVLVADAALAVSPEGTAQSHYDQGTAALRNKDADRALIHLAKCLDLTRPETALGLECQWELGWAYWLNNDWSKVFPLWEQVVKRDPSRPEASERLQTARANLKVAELSQRSAEGAPGSFVSQASDQATLRLRAVGDLMIGTTFPEGYLPSDDAKNTFDDVGPWLRDADLTFGNLEGPICDTGETKKCNPNKPPGRCYAFRSQAAIQRSLKKPDSTS